MPLPTLPLLQVEHLSRRFGSQWALADVSFHLPRGSATLLTGPNGSGKTTLLRLVAGALRPDHGTITLDSQAHRHALRRGTALLSHESYAYEPLTPLQNLHYFASVLGCSTQTASLMAMLDTVGLVAHAHVPVETLSAGMHRRFALARMLLQEPLLALFDEPYSSLDSEGIQLLERTFSSLRAKGTTLLISSHLIERTSLHCDRLLELDQGRVRRDEAAA